MSEFCCNKIYLEINYDLVFRLITNINNHLDLPFSHKLYKYCKFGEQKHKSIFEGTKEWLEGIEFYKA